MANPWEEFSSSSSTAPWEQFSTPTKKEEATGPWDKFKALGKAAIEHPGQIVPGAAEALAGGVAGMAEAAVGGLAAIGTTIAGKGPQAGLEAVRGVAEKIPTQPETEVGKAALEVLGIIPETIHKGGELAFEKTGSPLIGATTEAALTALTLFPTMKVGKLEKDKISSVSKTEIKEGTPSKGKETSFVSTTVEDSFGKKIPGFKYEFKTGETSKGILELGQTDSTIFPSYVDNGLSWGESSKGSVVKAYEKAIRFAEEQNKSFVSDSSVTLPAINIYESLSKKGYDVQKNPKARLAEPPEVVTSRWITPDDSPVFTVKPPHATTPESIPSKLQHIENTMKPKPERAMGQMQDEPFHPNTSKIETTKDLSKALDWTQTAATADATIIRQNWEKAQTQGYTPELGRKFRDYSEGSIKELTPDEKLAYDMQIKPIKDEYESIIREHREFDLDKEIGARIALGHRSFVDRIISGDVTGGFSRIGAKPSGLKSRTVFSLEDGTIITLGKGGKVTEWRGGEQVGTSLVTKKLKEGDEFNGKKVVQAKQKDIEENTPIRYLNDDMAVWSIKLAEAKKYQRESALLENLKQSEFFKANSFTKGDKDIPGDWRQIRGVEKLPQLRDQYFEPRVAEVFEDFITNNKGDRVQLLEGINNLAIKSFMINPVPHIMNEAAHWYVARGLSGLFTPKGVKGILGTMGDSIGSVISQDKFQTDLLKHGAPLTYPSVANQRVWTNLLNGQLKSAMSDGRIATLAKQLGTSPAKLFEAITQKSNAVMWATRDVMYTQLIKEHMSKGKTMEEAIKEVGSHMPEYRLPSRVLGSRDLSKLMQNRNLTVFSRYHYGMLKSLGEIGKELRTPGSRVQGLDHLGAIIAGMTLLFPAFDASYQAIFGREDIKERRAGPFHLLEGLKDVAEGEKRAAQVITSLLTPSPALVMGVELPFNVQLFSGQPIYQEQTSPETIALDLSKYVGGKLFSPGQTATAMIEGKSKPDEYALKQLDIETKTTEKKRKQERAKRRREAAARKHQQEMEKIYGY